jgi:hypothetical protein
MRSNSRARPTTTPAAWLLPEPAHLSLIQMRDHLRLLARLTDTGTAASDATAKVTPDAMAWCFSRLARDLDDVIDAAHWSH